MTETLKIHQFPPIIGMQPSPFGLKLETWLRFMEVSYQVEHSFTDLGPKGKVPFMTYQGEKTGDSELIIEKLSGKFGRDLEGDLSAQQKANSIMLRRLIEDHLYFIIVYSRWVDETLWPEFSRLVFQSVPAFIRPMIKSKGRKSVLQTLHYQGISRHERHEVYQMADHDLSALSEALADKQYFLGSKPTLLDASAYGAIANIFYEPYKNELMTILSDYPNLIDYCKRIKEQYWADAKTGGGEKTSYEVPAQNQLFKLKSA